MHRKLCFDVDGVIANFTDSYSAAITRLTGIALPKASDSFPHTWYWDREILSQEQLEMVWDTAIRPEGANFWLALAPLPNAIETIHRLNVLSKQGHEVTFMTAREGDRAKTQTEMWLHSYGMDYPTVLVTNDKILIVDALKMDFFVDDRLYTVDDLARRMEMFEIFDEPRPVKDRIYLVNRPYNQEPCHAFIKRVASVKEALQLEGLW